MTQQQNLAARESNERNGKDQIVITAIEVKNAQARLKFLPSKLGRYCIAFENAIYNWMTRNAVAYNGGYWDFFNCRMAVFICNRQKAICSLHRMDLWTM
ncbi:hypothetical protein AB6H32_22980 [Providencia hangzhouensis]